MNLSVERIEDEAVFDEWRQYRGVARRSLARARLFADELGLGLGLELKPGRGLGLGPGSADGSGRIPLIGVVGSKGKGTIALYASAALAAAGHRVGTVMSPGVLSNRDRIRVGGKALTEQEYRDLLEVVRQAKRRLPPVGAEGSDGGYLSPTGTFTLSGAYALVEAGCTAIVLEAGIGGASDELSLFEPDVAAVGAIFGEHLDLLGPTVLDVAKDKLGIVKDRTEVIVTVPQDDTVEQIIRETARVRRARIASTSAAGTPASLASWLPPGFGTANAHAGILAARALLALSDRNQQSETEAEPETGTETETETEAEADHDLIRVLKTVRYPGRLSVHDEPTDGSKLVLDTAVSGTGLRAALEFAARTFGGEPDRVLVSLPATKDFDGFLRELRDLRCPRYFVELTREHLAYPDKSQWPWPENWVGEDSLPDELLRGNVLAVGTVSFVTALMNRLHVDAERLFVG